eukprot:EG_transcript_45400
MRGGDTVPVTLHLLRCAAEWPHGCRSMGGSQNEPNVDHATAWGAIPFHSSRPTATSFLSERNVWSIVLNQKNQQSILKRGANFPFSDGVGCRERKLPCLLRWVNAAPPYGAGASVCFASAARAEWEGPR